MSDDDNQDQAKLRAAKKAAAAKRWREKFKANDPDGFRRYTRQKCNESYARLSPERKKKHTEKSSAWLAAWKERDPDGYRVYHRDRTARHNVKRQANGYKRKTTLVNGCNVGDNYYLARRLIKAGLSVEDYDSMFSVVPHCAVCETPPRHKYALHIDHDHVTGRVRGLLCSACNTAIGKLGDTATGVHRAVEYLGGI